MFADDTRLAATMQPWRTAVAEGAELIAANSKRTRTNSEFV